MVAIVMAMAMAMVAAVIAVIVLVFEEPQIDVLTHRLVAGGIWMGVVAVPRRRDLARRSPTRELEYRTTSPQLVEIDDAVQVGLVAHQLVQCQALHLHVRSPTGCRGGSTTRNDSHADDLHAGRVDLVDDHLGPRLNLRSGESAGDVVRAL